MRLSFPKLKNRKKPVGFLLACLLFCLFPGVALAGYVQSALLGAYTATAQKDFFFTSDLLREEPALPTYELYHDWQAEETAAIVIKLRNYQDALHIAQGDIAYTAEASASGGGASGVISAGAGGREKTVTLTVPRPADPNAPLEVVVTATAVSPYEKTLQGRFVIRPAVAYEMQENAGAPVALLVVTLAQSAQPEKNVTISWPAGAAPDMTNPIVTGAVSLDLENRTLTAALPTASVCELVFFKDGPADGYTGVTVSGA